MKEARGVGAGGVHAPERVRQSRRAGRQRTASDAGLERHLPRLAARRVRADAGRDFYGRQLKDWKGSAEIEQMVPKGMAAYGRLCGSTLARAHARSGDRIAIASYLGKGQRFDRAIVQFSHAYAEQNELDYEALPRPSNPGGSRPRPACDTGPIRPSGPSRHSAPAQHAGSARALRSSRCEDPAMHLETLKVNQREAAHNGARTTLSQPGGHDRESSTATLIAALARASACSRGRIGPGPAPVPRGCTRPASGASDAEL